MQASRYLVAIRDNPVNENHEELQFKVNRQHPSIGRGTYPRKGCRNYAVSTIYYEIYYFSLVVLHGQMLVKSS